MVITRKIKQKNLIDTNKVFGGWVKNKNYIDSAVERANREKSPIKRASLLTRAMTSDHAFGDGNKRTASIVTLSEMRKENYKVDKKRLTNVMVNLAKTGEGDLNKIQRKLRRCFKK